VAETLGVEDAEPWLHPKFEFTLGSQPLLTANFGTGENPAKRVEDPFEEGVLRLMTELGPLVMVDVGAPGSEEEGRVRRVMDAVGTERVAAHEGPFASFAAMIAASRGYFGYDSAGQHVAAALGVPLASVFAGYASERMLARWSPEGPGEKRVIAAQDRPADELLDEVRDAFKEMFR
jgi:ADP-heptose:LPS heptosyltransferase